MGKKDHMRKCNSLKNLKGKNSTELNNSKSKSTLRRQASSPYLRGSTNKSSSYEHMIKDQLKKSFTTSAPKFDKALHHQHPREPLIYKNAKNSSVYRSLSKKKLNGYHNKIGVSP